MLHAILAKPGLLMIYGGAGLAIAVWGLHAEGVVTGQAWYDLGFGGLALSILGLILSYAGPWFSAWVNIQLSNRESDKNLQVLKSEFEEHKQGVAIRHQFIIGRQDQIISRLDHIDKTTTDVAEIAAKIAADEVAAMGAVLSKRLAKEVVEIVCDTDAHALTPVLLHPEQPDAEVKFVKKDGSPGPDAGHAS